jgi:sortase A
MAKRNKIFTGIGLLLLAAALFLTAFNIVSDARAGKTAYTVLDQLAPETESQEISQPTPTPKETVIPDYILNPEMAMPEEEVDGQKYIGVLRIPTLSLELPVISEWSYPSLQIAPCRYAGSAYLNNMVIAAHNYYSHFGYLKDLSQGDEVTFTDIDGNVFKYKVVEIETLSPFATEEMTSGDWALTLFTCTVGGQSRVTVRCELAE